MMCVLEGFGGRVARGDQSFGNSASAVRLEESQGPHFPGSDQ